MISQRLRAYRSAWMEPIQIHLRFVRNVYLPVVNVQIHKNVQAVWPILGCLRNPVSIHVRISSIMHQTDYVSHAKTYVINVSLSYYA